MLQSSQIGWFSHSRVRENQKIREVLGSDVLQPLIVFWPQWSDLIQRLWQAPDFSNHPGKDPNGNSIYIQTSEHESLFNYNYILFLPTIQKKPDSLSLTVTATFQQNYFSKMENSHSQLCSTNAFINPSYGSNKVIWGILNTTSSSERHIIRDWNSCSLGSNKVRRCILDSIGMK